MCIRDRPREAEERERAEDAEVLGEGVEQGVPLLRVVVEERGVAAKAADDEEREEEERRVVEGEARDERGGAADGERGPRAVEEARGEEVGREEDARREDDARALELLRLRNENAILKHKYDALFHERLIKPGEVVVDASMTPGKAARLQNLQNPRYRRL